MRKQIYLRKEFKKIVRIAGIVIIAFLLGFYLGAEYVLCKALDVAERLGLKIDLAMVHEAIFRYFNRI